LRPCVFAKGIATSIADISLLYNSAGGYESDAVLLTVLFASLSLLILFGFSTALLWNGGREPQRGGQTTFA
jgi:hypothetical protein